MNIPKGRIFHAMAQPDLQRTRPLYAFVPEELLTPGSFDEEAYRAKRWATINAGANKDAVGSHVYPDLSRPAPPGQTTEFRSELARHIHKSLGAPNPDRKPGRGGQGPEMA